MRAPSYICKDRHGGYLFRRKIPTLIRSLFGGRSEFRKSLQTHHRPTAIVRARKVAMATDDIYQKLADVTWAITLADEAIEKAQRKAFEANQEYETLLQLADEHFTAVASGEETEQGTAEQYTEMLAIMNMLMEREEEGKRELAVATEKKKALERLKEQLAGEIVANQLASEFDWELPTPQPNVPDLAKNPLIKSVPLRSIWDDYIKEHSQQWQKGTLAENNEAFRAFIEIAGEISTTDLNVEVVRNYKREYSDYPAHRTRGANAKLSLEELREKSDARLSHASVSNRMTLINGFLNWAEKHKYIEENPLSELVPKRDKSKRDRDPFTLDDLTLMFGHPKFTQGAYKNDWEFWLPVLAVYTGARMGELCQLKGSDVVGTNGITYFNIHDYDENTLKTSNSIRKIPIHRHLVELGILELAEKRGKLHLFDIQQHTEKRSHYPSKRFGTFKSKLGFGRRKTFHSFRHTFRDALSRADVRDSLVSTLMGHHESNITFRTYGSEASLEQLDAAIQKINYEGALHNIRTKAMLNEALNKSA